MRYEINFRFEYDVEDKFYGWVKDDFRYETIVACYKEIVSQAIKRRIYGYQILEYSDKGEVPLVIDHKDCP